MLKKTSTKKTVGHARWAAHTQKWQYGYPPYGPFLHTHPQNVTLLGGPSNAIKRVVVVSEVRGYDSPKLIVVSGGTEYTTPQS